MKTKKKTTGPKNSARGLRSILEVLSRDHDDLRVMIEVLKSEDADHAKKKKAYREFSELLKSHASCEEKAVYEMALKFKDLKVGTFEAYEEHAVATALMNKIAKTTHKDQWEGRVKVLAEAVEHHIKEEENEYLIDLKEKLKHDEELFMVDDFITRREKAPHQGVKGHNGILTKVGFDMDGSVSITH